MANPLPTVMAWEDYQQMVSDLMGGNMQVSTTLFTQILNDARNAIEEERDWNWLTKYDTSLSWTSADTWQTAKPLPSDFKRWRMEDAILLWDGNTVNPTIQPVSLIPYSEVLWSNTTSYLAAVDYTTMNIYFMGLAGQTWTVVLSYIKDFGDLVAKGDNNNVATTWGGFPARFHKFLGFDVTARIRLGASYDDIAARNANDNGASAERTKRAMEKSDSSIKRSIIRNRDFFQPGEPVFVNHQIPRN